MCCCCTQDIASVTETKCGTGGQNPSLVVFGFLFNHNLHCICFKLLFTESKYLVSNLHYTRLVRTITKGKKSNKKFNIFRIIIILLHYPEIISDHKGLYSV